MHKRLCFVLLLLGLIGILNGQAQSVHIPIVPLIETSAYHSLDNPFHSSIFPYNPFDSLPDRQTLGAFDDVLRKRMHLNDTFANNNWLGRKLLNEHFIEIRDEKENYSTIVNPLLNLRLGTDRNWLDNQLNDKSPYQNTRGIQLMGNIGPKVIYYSDFWENQARFPHYVQNYVDSLNVVPGQGGFKSFMDSEAKDYAYANGYVSFQANRFFNFQFGHGKHFIGDGYRSLMLSDNAFNYPYFRITTQFWKIKYWILYTKMLDINNTYPDGTYFNKYTTFHYLSFNVSKRLNIGLFETIVYGDETQARGYDLNYLNPIIFFRPVEFSLGSRGGNALLGLNLKWKLTDKIYTYGQFILDEFKLSEFRKNSGWWANKYGVQWGIKSYDSFVKGLTLQTEFNTIRPYTFSHRKDFQNYGHYNQPLAHPMGSNFVESFSRIAYQNKRFITDVRLVYAVQGRDTLNSNWGSDIFLSYDSRERDYENETLQGVRTTTWYIDAKLAYILNSKTNLRVEMGYIYRRVRNKNALILSHTTNYPYVGLVSTLQNHYYDY